MSWAASEWKDGLSARALQKVEENERQLDRLNKQGQQKQFQLDTLQQVGVLNTYDQDYRV